MTSRKRKPAYPLGTSVTVPDYLRRVELGQWLGDREVERRRAMIADLWPDAAIADSNGVLPTKLWIAESIHARLFTELGLWVHEDCRNNPTIAGHALTLPVDGIVVGKVTLQDGKPLYEGNANTWYATRAYTGYRVAYHLSRRPLTVLPSMIVRQADDH